MPSANENVSSSIIPNPKNIKAVALLSGGLDSAIAAKLVLDQGIDVYGINYNEKFSIDRGTHYFDLVTKSVQAKSANQLQIETAAATLEKENAKRKAFLASTDWKVLRHIRQQALGQPTSLTHQQYIELETARAEAASNII